MTFLSPPNEVTHVHTEENQTTPRHVVSSKGSEDRELLLCSAQGWLTGSSSQTSRTRALLIPQCCYLSTHRHFRTAGCLNKKNNPLVFLLHILALPSASHLARYQPLPTTCCCSLWLPHKLKSLALILQWIKTHMGVSWCWKAEKDHVYIWKTMYIFFPSQFRLGCVKLPSLCPWNSFTIPDTSKTSPAWWKKKLLVGKKRVWLSMAWCEPQECIHQPGAPSTADPLGSPSTPGPQGRLSTWGSATPSKAQGTQSTFTKPLQTPGCHSAQRCFIQERNLEHELFSL